MKLRKKHPRILLCLSMFAIACETDPLNEQNQSSNGTELKLETLSFSDFSKNNVALQKLNDVLQSGGNSSPQRKSINVKEYGYDIDTESAIRITQGEFHTITFRIQGEPDANIIENLILVSNGKDYTAYIAEYILTDKEREMLVLGLKPRNIIPSTLLEVGKKARINIGGNGSNCVRVAIITKDYCDDKNGNRITHNGDNDGRCVANWTKEEYTVLFINKGCLAGSGVGHGPTTGSGNTGGVSIGPRSGGGGDGSPGREDTGSGSITEGGNTIVTTPILLPDTRNNIRNHTRELNRITNRTEVKEKIEELRAAVRTIQTELGAEFFIEDYNDESAEYRIEVERPQYAGIDFGPVYEHSILRVHMHHSPGLEPVFSSEDIDGMGYYYKRKKEHEAPDAENITSLLVSELGLFTLKVTNPRKAKNFANKLSDESFKNNFNLKYYKDVREKARDDCNCRLPNVEYDKLLSDYLIDF